MLSGWKELISLPISHCASGVVPKAAKRLVPATVKIARSYCFSSKLDTREKPAPLGVRIFNHVFSSMPVSAEIDDFVVEDCQLPSGWRRRFWGTSNGNWDTHPVPLGRHEHTGLSWKQECQQDLLRQGRSRLHGPARNFEQEVAKREARVSRRRDSEPRREHVVRMLQESSSTSSSSSDSSSSS